MDYERLAVDNLPLADSVVRPIGRRHRLSADDEEELAASVRLKLVENDYEVLRKFEGRGQLRTPGVYRRRGCDAPASTKRRTSSVNGAQMSVLFIPPASHLDSCRLRPDIDD